MDHEDNILDTLLNNAYIMPANVSINNIVNNPSTTHLTISDINFSNVKKIKSISSFTTTSITEHVKILSDYEIEVIISAKQMHRIN